MNFFYNLLTCVVCNLFFQFAHSPIDKTYFLFIFWFCLKQLLDSIGEILQHFLDAVILNKLLTIASQNSFLHQIFVELLPHCFHLLEVDAADHNCPVPIKNMEIKSKNSLIKQQQSELQNNVESSVKQLIISPSILIRN